MTDLAAHLVDHVVPFVPVRQLVLSLPPRLRYQLAYDPARCSAVLRIFARAVRGFYRARAAERGHRGGHTGAVTFIQRLVRPCAERMTGRTGPDDGRPSRREAPLMAPGSPHPAAARMRSCTG